MVDPLEAVLCYLRADTALAALVSTRIDSRHRYGGTWTAAQSGLMVRLDGGQPNIDVALQPIRLEVRCYAPSQYQAMAIWKRLVEISRAVSRNSASVTGGKSLLYRLNQESGPSALYDTEVGMDFVMCFFSALVAEGAVLA
jgi:hypothetical protein